MLKCKMSNGTIHTNGAWQIAWVPTMRGAKFSSVVERSLMVRWVVGSILHDGSIELFLIPDSASR